MAPEYGATCGFFPIDTATLEYLRNTGRARAHVELVEQYARAQGLFRTQDTPDPEYTDTVSLDLGSVEPSMAGPKRPQDRVPLGGVAADFRKSYGEQAAHGKQVQVNLNGQQAALGHGAVVIAAITSCTNTSNPSVMVGAGLLAKKAVERGLSRKPWVKTSLAPGSQVVTDYLNAAGLTLYLERLGFHTVGYGCTTCIGNSGPLPEAVSKAIRESDLVVADVISGNRNFEGRIHPDVKANYLASPMLVVAYALAGSVDVDLTCDPLGQDAGGKPVHLRDIWPTQEEIAQTMAAALNPRMFAGRYSHVSEGPEEWRALPVPEGDLFQWDPGSTYIREVPFFQGLKSKPQEPRDLVGARVLVLLGDSITTDHISPAGSIPATRPAGQYLVGKGVKPADFNSFGARRGNHEVMMRGTFGNVRLKNRLTPELEGDWTLLLPEGQPTSIFEAAMAYQAQGVPAIVIAGKEYGSGSSRDWAAKGPALLGVRAVIAESYERIHRSNLVGMGVLPLQFRQGESAASLGLTGRETYEIRGIGQGLKPGQELEVRAARSDGSASSFRVLARIDNRVEVEYYRHGGVLNAVLRQMLASN
jgi:aconitate hydratase